MPKDSGVIELIEAIAAALIAMAILNLLGAWFVMLGLGVAHDLWPQVPATGYWATYLMLCALGTIASAIRGTRGKRAVPEHN